MKCTTITFKILMVSMLLMVSACNKENDNDDPKNTEEHSYDMTITGESLNSPIVLKGTVPVDDINSDRTLSSIYSTASGGYINLNINTPDLYVQSTILMPNDTPLPFAEKRGEGSELYISIDQSRFIQSVSGSVSLKDLELKRFSEINSYTGYILTFEGIFEDQNTSDPNEYEVSGTITVKLPS